MQGKIRVTSVTFLVMVFWLAHPCSAQQSENISNNPWSNWDFLLGNWTGEGSGKPGQGGGTFSFKPDLDNAVLVRKSYSEYPASGNKNAIIHDDLMIVYPGTDGTSMKAVYFDNEKHVINYTVTFTEGEKEIVFTSDSIENTPRFRLSYILLENDKVNVKFEFAPPGKPDAFSTYVEGISVRSK